MSRIMLVVSPKGGEPFEFELTAVIAKGAAMARQLQRLDDEAEFVELLARLSVIGEADLDHGPRTRES